MAKRGNIRSFYERTSGKSAGFSMMQVMVAFGVSTIAVLGVAKAMRDASKAQKSMAAAADLRSLSNFLEQSFSYSPPSGSSASSPAVSAACNAIFNTNHGISPPTTESSTQTLPDRVVDALLSTGGYTNRIFGTYQISKIDLKNIKSQYYLKGPSTVGLFELTVWAERTSQNTGSAQGTTLGGNLNTQKYRFLIDPSLSPVRCIAINSPESACYMMGGSTYNPTPSPGVAKCEIAKNVLCDKDKVADGHYDSTSHQCQMTAKPENPPQPKITPSPVPSSLSINQCTASSSYQVWKAGKCADLSKDGKCVRWEHGSCENPQDYPPPPCSVTLNKSSINTTRENNVFKQVTFHVNGYYNNPKSWRCNLEATVKFPLKNTLYPNSESFSWGGGGSCTPDGSKEVCTQRFRLTDDPKKTKDEDFHISIPSRPVGSNVGKPDDPPRAGAYFVGEPAYSLRLTCPSGGNVTCARDADDDADGPRVCECTDGVSTPPVREPADFVAPNEPTPTPVQGGSTTQGATSNDSSSAKTSEAGSSDTNPSTDSKKPAGWCKITLRRPCTQANAADFLNTWGTLASGDSAPVSQGAKSFAQQMTESGGFKDPGPGNESLSKCAARITEPDGGYQKWCGINANDISTQWMPNP